FTVPDRNAVLLLHIDVEKTSKNFEHAGNYAIQRKIWTQRFLVEIVQGGALLFGPIPDIPRLKLLPGERLQLPILFAEAFFGFVAEVLDKELRVRSGMRHAIFENQVGEVLEAEQPGFLAAQFENLLD